MKKFLLIMIMYSLMFFVNCDDGDSKTKNTAISTNPSNLSAMATSPSSIRMTWVDNSTDETAFGIYRSTSSTSGFSEIDSVDANMTEYSDTGLTPQTTYYYQVTKKTSGGETGSAQISVSTPPENTTINVPNAPDNFRITSRTSTSITLAWDDNSNNETGFKLTTERWNSELGIGVIFLPETLSANTTARTYTGLNENTNYYFFLYSYNANGNSISVVTSGMTNSADPPVLTGPATVTSGTEFSINWTFTDPSTLNDADDHYEIQFSYTNNSTFQVLGSQGSPPLPGADNANITITDEGIYYFRIKAVYDYKYVYSNVLQIHCDEAPVLSYDIPPSYDNLLLYSSENGTVENTTYADADLAAGYNFEFNVANDIEYMTCTGAASLIKFAMPSDVMGKTVLYAELRFWVSEMPEDLNTVYRVAAVAELWNPSSVYWNSRPNFYTTGQGEADPPTDPYQPVTFNVTAIVQAWANGDIANNGFFMYDPNYMYPGDTAYRGTNFYSVDTSTVPLRAHLYIEYQ